MNEEHIEKSQSAVARLLRIMHRLRKECPWDAKQTHESLKPYLLEEAYEVLESIDHKNSDALAKELGDLLLQIVFHSEIANENDQFRFSEVADHIADKLVSRHPHVFEDSEANDAAEVQNNWEHNKFQNEQRESLLDGIPEAAPALLQAQRMQEKAATVGFDWPEVQQVMDKVEEEWQELKAAIQNKNETSIRNEFGDLLFSMVNFGRFLEINAEDALRITNNKFYHRFRYIEKAYNNDPKALKNATLDELEAHWKQSKKTSSE